MTAKQTLCEYRPALRHTQRCFRELNDARGGGVRSPSFNGFPRTPGIGSSSVELQVEKIESLEQKAAKARRKALDLAEQIEDMLDALEDYTEKAVIRLHYLEGYTWQQVGTLLHLTDRSIRRIHGRAIKRLEANNNS